MRYSLASDILDQESPEAARATLVEALKQAQQQLGAQHPYTLVAACYLGSWLLRAAHRMAYRGHLYDVTAGNYLMDPPGGVLPKSQAMEAADALRAEADACVVMLVDADLTGKLSMDAARSVLEAADCLARAVADSEQGPDAPAMAATGVDALQKVHALAVQVFGEEHYEALRRMQPIVQQYHVRESSAYDPQAAEDLCKHALESCTAALGATHVTTLRLASELASYGDGQDGEAAARAARAQIAAVLQQQVQVLGGEHADVQHTLWRLLAVQSDSEWSGSPIERLRELWNLPNLYEVPEQLWPVPLF